jgi:hypothetical protein
MPMRLRTRTLALESARYAHRWQPRTNPRLSSDPELPEWDWGRVGILLERSPQINGTNKLQSFAVFKLLMRQVRSFLTPTGSKSGKKW